MKVVLAEKPSVAQDIASVLGANSRLAGYWQGNDYAVTYAFGHLVTIAEPEEMNAGWGKPWTLEQLPMIPAQWKYRVVDKVDSQFKVIKNLFLDPATTGIICATDAGREGEHIFRLIYMLTNCKKPVQRLWISSLTSEAIQEGFRKLRPSGEFDNLASAATARAHADWVVGLNFTRAYTVINKQLCTIGRVQTPTLALITQRQAEIDSFRPVPFFEIVVTFEPGFTAYYITPGDKQEKRLPDKASALAILNAITPRPNGLVKSIETVEKKTRPPCLFDLLTLQKEANRRFGYTAQETLDIAQALYEKYKLLSYPRTESRHLSTDMIDKLPGIVSAVLNSSVINRLTHSAFAELGITPDSVTVDLLRPSLTKSYVDNTRLTDHHAIIPTHKLAPADLPDRESNIYRLVASRFLSIFLPPEIRDETSVIISIDEHLFRSRGVVIKQPGWTVLEEIRSDDKNTADESQQLPVLKQDQLVAKRMAELKEGKTSAPKPYDDASLLTAMKNAGQVIDDEDLASYMRQSGLGTAATRAAIIERLLQSGYIERNKKALVPTIKGKAIIDSVHKDLKDVSLTASWEQRLAEIQDGKLSPGAFEHDISAFVCQILPDITRQEATLPVVVKEGIGSCPQCKLGTIQSTPKGAGCSRWKEGCKFTIWREQFGKKLTDAQILELFEKHRTKAIKGFKKKDGSGTYEARLVLADDFKVHLDFDNKG